MKRAYCLNCKRKHAAAIWYGHSEHDADAESLWCGKAARWAHRNSGPHEVNHPMWVELSRHLQDVDQTGYLIAKIAWRPDAQGLLVVGAQMRCHRRWQNSGDAIFMGALLLQCYFPWPMQCLWDALKSRKPHSVNARTCKTAWTSLEASFA